MRSYHRALRGTPQPAVNTSEGALTLSELVGNTPVLWIPDLTGRGDAGFWAKLEGFNPGGMKDRPALHMVRRALARGDLTPDAPIIESTSGTLGLGLALAGIAYGHPVHLVTDSELEPLMRQSLAAYGTYVHIVTTPHPTGGWQQARRDRVQQLLEQNPDAWCPDQYHNPDNVTAYAPMATELLTQLTNVDILVCSVGTGGHSAGIAMALREHLPDLRLIGVDAVGSAIFGQPARSRLMRGLGSSIYPGNVAYQQFDEVHWVAPADAVWACRQLAKHRYASGGWSVGAVALVASWTARVNPGTRIVAVFPDGPARYFGTIYNDAYCRTHNLLPHCPPQEPERIEHPTAREVTRWTHCQTVLDPIAATTRPAGPGTAAVGQ